jgi:dimethylglycine dehydrogenase
MLDHARVVIVGGGSLGVSLLYHLTKEGWTDILLVEKGELTSGSTWHAAGLIPNFNGNMTVAKIHQASIDLYTKEIPQLTGLDTPFHTTGSLRLGFTQLEEQWYRNIESLAQNVSYEFEFVSKSKAEELCPLMNFDKARCIISTPNDGHVDPTSVVMPMAQAARANGATISRYNRVTEIQQLASGEWQVTTLICMRMTGAFAPDLDGMIGVAAKE